MSDTHCLFIDGRPVCGGGRGTLPVVNPATTQACAELTCATDQDADKAAEAAAAAHGMWSQSAPGERAAVLDAMAGKVDVHREEIAGQITLEQGKPFGEALVELDGVSANLRYYAGIAKSFPFETVVGGGAERHIREAAIGPVLIMNTWNFPVETITSHLAPALAAGCSAVVLANRDTPGSAATFFRAICELDLPAGLVNLLMGRSSSLSRRLIAHPSMRHVSYTGSIDVGRKIAIDAASVLKRATLELGGLAPAIVLPGSDVADAAAAFGGKRFWNAGQVCTAPNCMYVNRNQYSEFVDKLATYADSLTLGDGFAAGTDLGPLANERRPARMQDIVADALSRGARMVTGQSEAKSNSGYFWKPTVLADVHDDTLGMREEIFGPIALVRPFDDLESLIVNANSSDIGLSGYVYGPDTAVACDVAKRLDVGSVGANQMVTAFLDTPFGGVKNSGMGTIGGPRALHEYLFPRLIATPNGGAVGGGS